MVNWHEVTPFSRMVALILFVGVIPVLFFYLGMQYQDLQESKSMMHSYGFPRLESYSPIQPALIGSAATGTVSE